MIRSTQKSFQEVLESHMDKSSGGTHSSASYEGISSSENNLFNTIDSLRMFALKNIKTNFSNTTYRVHLANQETKRAEALLLKYQSLQSKLENSEVKKAFQFFFEAGATGFLDLTPGSLRKDFRILAKKLHPDLSQKPLSPSEKAQEFDTLKKSFDRLVQHFRSL